MEREVKRCWNCLLNQFVSHSGLCRKCREPLEKPELETAVPRLPPSQLTTNIAAAVTLIRKATGISQQKLADEARVFRTYIVKVEGGYCLPNIRSLEKIAAVLNVSMYGLVTIAEAMGNRV